MIHEFPIEQGSIQKEMAVLELTFSCNYSCPFCFLPWLDHPELYGRELDAQSWIRIIDRLASQGVRFFQISGGEPLLSRALLPIVEHFVEHLPKTKFAIYTNASLISANLLDSLKESEGMIFTTLQSVHSYERMTGSEMTLSQWEDNCRLVTESGIPLQIAITVTKATLHELRRMLTTAISLNPVQIQINPILIEGRAKWHPSLWLSSADHEKIQEQVSLVQRKTEIPLIVVKETHCSCREDSIVPAGMSPQPPIKDCVGCADLLVVGADGRRRKCTHTYIPMERMEEGDDKHTHAHETLINGR